MEMNQTPRVLRPNPSELELRPSDLESLLAEDHRGRAIWESVEGLDLSALYERIRAVEGHTGRPAIDPAILVALWIYATSEGVGSARALERLCEAHDAYRWICGRVRSGGSQEVLPGQGSVTEHKRLCCTRIPPVSSRSRALPRPRPEPRLEGQALAGGLQHSPPPPHRGDTSTIS